MDIVNHVTPIICKTFNAAHLTNHWKKIDDAFGTDISIIRISNDSNVAVKISFDGDNLHDWLSSNQVLELISIGNSFASHWPPDTTMWVKQDTDAGVGTIYVSAYCLFRNI